MTLSRWASLAAVVQLACCAPAAGVMTDVQSRDATVSDSEFAVDSSVAPDVAPRDGAAPADASLPMDASSPQCVGRPAQCAMGVNGGACGDALYPPACVNGAWTCAEGMVFVTSCACIGRAPGSSCTCASSGWRCDDSGVARRFACGPAITCLGGAELCAVTLPGVPGASPRYECRALPAACGARPTCACISETPSTQCTQSAAGDLTVTIALP